MEQTYERGVRVQKDTLASLDETIRITELCKATGVNVNQELTIQTEKLKNVHDETKQVNSNLEKGSKELRIFSRRMATDRFIQTLICLIVCGIITIIIILTIKHK
jgi:t-SNARE complex subunit (syntaxin)